MTSPSVHATTSTRSASVLALHGELDEPASTELRETIMKATIELTSDLTIDLADVTFLPSPAIGVLATSQAGARSNGADDHLRGTRGLRLRALADHLRARLRRGAD